MLQDTYQFFPKLKELKVQFEKDFDQTSKFEQTEQFLYLLVENENKMNLKTIQIDWALLTDDYFTFKQVSASQKYFQKPKGFKSIIPTDNQHVEIIIPKLSFELVNLLYYQLCDWIENVIPETRLMINTCLIVICPEDESMQNEIDF